MALVSMVFAEARMLAFVLLSFDIEDFLKTSLVVPSSLSTVYGCLLLSF